MRKPTVFGACVSQATVHGSSRALTVAPVCRNDINPVRCRGAKSFVDDLAFCQGVVLGRAAAILRSIETKPYDWEICPLQTDTSRFTVQLMLRAENASTRQLSRPARLARANGGSSRDSLKVSPY